MTNLTPAATFDDVYQIEITDPVRGGAGGIDNLPHQALANRDAYLRQSITDLAAVVAASPGRLLRTTVYLNSSGTQYVSVDGSAPTTLNASTFTPMAAETKARVIAVAGGGAGGGTPSTTAGVSAVGGGGGSGAIGIGLFNSASIGTNQTVTIGLGGAATNGTNGGNGGATSFGSLLSVAGGVGGPYTLASTVSAITGGVAGGSVAGANIIASPGAVGGSAFILSPGTSQISGNGAAGYLAAGMGQQATGGNGGNGGGYGSGGGGGARSASQGASSGGSGAPGLLIIEEFA
jgi:hypothetical protein